MKICLDYDATLVDLMTPWMKWIRRTYNCTFTTRQITRFYFLGDVLGTEVHDFWKTEGCYNKVSPIEGSQEFVKKLQDTYGKENIHIVTATNKHMQEEKTNHIIQNFNVPESLIHHIREKFKVTKNSVLIDDYLMHCCAHINANNNHAILFNDNNSYGWGLLNTPENIEIMNRTLDKNKLHTAFCYDSILTKLKLIGDIL